MIHATILAALCVVGLALFCAQPDPIALVFAINCGLLSAIVAVDAL